MALRVDERPTPVLMMLKAAKEAAQMPPLPHQQVTDEEAYSGLNCASVMACKWSAEFTEMFERAERHSDGVLLENYYEAKAAFRRTCKQGSAPHEAFFRFHRVADELMQQRVREAGLYGFEAGYDAAMAALGIDVNAKGES